MENEPIPREVLLERQIQDLNKKFQWMTQRLLEEDEARAEEEEANTSKAKQRETRTTRRSFLNTIASSIGEAFASPPTITQNEPRGLSAPPSYTSDSEVSFISDPKVVYIRKVELMLNGIPVDQIQYYKTFQEAVIAY